MKNSSWWKKLVLTSQKVMLVFGCIGKQSCVMIVCRLAKRLIQTTTINN